MRALECECSMRFESAREAVDHGKANLHRVSGLYFSHRLELEEHFHTCGICTHEPLRLDARTVTTCIARNAVATGGVA